MQKPLLFLFLLAIIYAPATAQYNHRVNISFQPGVAMPLGSMSTYYKTGVGGEIHTIVAINKRQSLFRLSAIVNTGYYHLSGHSFYDFDNAGNYVEYKPDPISIIPLHGGLRLDLGGNSDMRWGMYFSQDFGLTYINGPTGGSRFGQAFNCGTYFSRVDVVVGFNSWVRSTGTKFHFVTIGLGIII